MEAQLKGREGAVAAGLRRRQEQERLLVHLRGEARGLKARLAAANQQNQVPSSGSASRFTEPTLRPFGPVSKARSTSLRLQHEVVQLWALLRQCDDELEVLKTGNASSSSLAMTTERSAPSA